VKKIVVKLNDKSINDAIKLLTDYKNSLAKRTDRLVNNLADKGKEFAIDYVERAAYFSHTGITEGIEAVHMESGRALVKSTAPHSMYFEFGTGFVGKEAPHHPLVNEFEWQYDINNHGTAGWWYPTDESDGNPYKWTDPQGQLRAWTKGMPSRPFMYYTARYLEDIAEEEAKGVFRFD